MRMHGGSSVSAGQLQAPSVVQTLPRVTNSHRHFALLCTFSKHLSPAHLSPSQSNVSYLTKQGFLAARKGNLNLAPFLLDVFNMASQSTFQVRDTVKLEQKVAATPMLQGCTQQQ